MKLLAATFAMLALAASATPFETFVKDTCAGDIRVFCNDPGTWKFTIRHEKKEKLDELIVNISAPAPAAPPKFAATFEIPQRSMHHVWMDFATDGGRLHPDWARWWWSDIAHGQPLFAIHDGNNRNRFTMACSEALRRVEWRAVLREENCLVTGGFRFFTAPEAPIKDYEVRIRIDGRDLFWSDAVTEGAKWLADAAGLKPCRVPEASFDPVYSSWYSFHQNVFEKEIEAECTIAAKMGMKTIILDDGWQTDDNNRNYAFCGDWQVSKRRFPDMAAHVKRIHELGMKYMVWYSVPFIGEKSAAYERFKGKYLRSEKSRGTAILDPRFPEVRKFLVDTYVKAIKQWNIDGFKLDFIDTFAFGETDPAIAENYAGRDIRSLPHAVDLLMREVYAKLTAIKPDLLVEFRQDYIGPSIRQYGNLLRATDCPGDMQMNRMRCANLRLTAGEAAVHADMLEWHPSDTPEAAALPIISSLFSVIQYSMMLRDLPESHRRVIKHYLDFSQRHRATLLKGAFRAHHPEAQYPILEAWSEKERIFGVYTQGMVVPCNAPDRPTFLLNGTGQTGVVVELAAAPKTLKIFNAFGEVLASTLPASAGLVKLPVPSGGYAQMEF